MIDWEANRVSITNEKSCDCGHPLSHHVGPEQRCSYCTDEVRCMCVGQSTLGVARNELVTR